MLLLRLLGLARPSPGPTTLLLAALAERSKHRLLHRPACQAACLPARATLTNHGLYNKRTHLST